MKRRTASLAIPSVVTTTVWVLVFVFVCVPTLSRMHDHLSSGTRGAHFKFSRDIERPHEKHTLPALIPITTSTFDEGAGGERAAATDGSSSRFTIPPANNGNRAPPSDYRGL
jgi:hypothetical protein